MKKWKWYIFIILILITVLIAVVLIEKTDIKYFINGRKQTRMSMLAENNIWDISKAGDGSVMAKLSEDGTLTISGTGKMKDWLTNSSTEWHNNVYKNLVKNVVIEDGVTNIGNFAFRLFTNLTNIELPDGLTSIGANAFDECINLINIELPEGVTSIDDDAFYRCKSLTNIELPDGLTSIGANAFDECINLINIELPEGVTKIGNEAFSGCLSLTSIKVDINNEYYMDDNGVLYTKDGKQLLQYPPKKEDTSYKVLETVTSIGSNAFYRCSNLTNIELPEGVTSIRNEAFRACTSLEKINLPEGITTIETLTFYDCRSLTNIELPKGVTSIENGAFWSCRNLTNIKIPEGVTYIAENTFNDCRKLTNIEIPKGVTSIGKSAFFSCESLTNIEIPKGVTSIGIQAFAQCDNLTNIEIPAGVTSIGDSTFIRCHSLTKVIIPKTVTTIASNAFQYSENVNILCASNSTAESYAIENGLNYTLDDMAPNVEISNNGTNNPEKQMNTTVTVTDNLSGVSSTKYLWSTKSKNVEENEIINVLEEGNTITTPKVTGEYYLWILVEDNFENKAIVRSNAFILDNEGPTLEIQYTPNTYTRGNVTVNIKANEQIKEIGGWTLSNDKQILTKEYNDNKEETITVRDLAGNETNANIQINKIDKEKPTIILSQNGTTKPIKMANIEVTATDNLSGIKSIKYLWSIESEDVGENDITNVLEEGNTIATPEVTGEYYLWVLVEDNVGNKNKLRSNIFILDNTEPEIKISQNGTTETIKSANTEVTAADNLSGVSSTKFLWSTKSENVAENEIINVLEEGNTITTPKVTGEYYLWVLVEDNVGNKAIVRSNAFILDNTAPTLEIENIPETYTNGNVTVNIKANEQIQEIEGWTLSSDKQTLTKEYNDNTEETIEVRDLVGNETNANIRINKIDRESPTIRLSQNGTTEAVKEANIEVTATDNLSGIKSIKYLWSIESEDVGENNITNVLEEGNAIATPEATGEYYLWVLVEDNAGNKNKLRSNVFKLDNTAPEGEVTYNISEDKDICLVTIKSNKELQEIEGWTLTSDRLTLTKKYYENTEETITIKDKIGNTAAIKIEITGIEVPTFNVQEYKINGLYIRNIQPQTVYSNFIKNIVTNQSYEIKEGNITITGIDKIKTGQKLILKNITYTLVVTGDINGDGDIKLSDLSTLKMQLIGKRSLTGASKEAGDINEDGDIKLSDLSKMKKILIE